MTKVTLLLRNIVKYAAYIFVVVETVQFLLDKIDGLQKQPVDGSK